MKRSTLPFLIVGAILLASCSGPLQPSTPVVLATASQTATPTVTTTATSTRTPVPTRTPSPTPVPVIHTECLEVQAKLPADAPFSGKLVLVKPIRGPGDQVSLFDLSTREETILPDADPFDTVVSPNHSIYASLNFQAKRLEVTSTDGQLLKSIPWRSDWGWIAAWLDDQRIAIIMTRPDPSTPRYNKYPAAVTILNVFTGQSKEFSPDYPDIDRASPLSMLGRWGTTVYDPTLTRVVYLAPMRNLPPEFVSYMGVVLYDLVEHWKLAEIMDPMFNHPPLWFRDGSQFVVMGTDEFYRVSADGEVKKLTHFNPKYRPPESYNDSFELDYKVDWYYSLSPDERFLAFWLDHYSARKSSAEERGEDEEPNAKNQTLAILDLQTGKVTDTCIPVRYDSPLNLTAFYFPVWSPDSRSVAMLAKDPGVPEERSAVLVYPQAHAAYRLPSQWMPTGWLNSGSAD